MNYQKEIQRLLRMASKEQLRAVYFFILHFLG